MGADRVHEILARELGPRWASTKLVEFDDVPAASASIGQVHKARLARRARGRREDPVPRGGRGPDVRPQPDLARRPDGRVVAAGHRRQADHGRAQGADERGARLPPRGPPPAALRRRPSATTTTCSCPTCSSTPTTCSSPSGSTAPRCPGSSPRAPRRSATRPPRSTSSSCCAPRTGPGCCTPTRTRATSGSPTTGGSACSTSAPSTGSRTGCRPPWAGCSPRRWRVRPPRSRPGCATRASSARASTSTPTSCSPS